MGAVIAFIWHGSAPAGLFWVPTFGPSCVMHTVADRQLCNCQCAGQLQLHRKGLAMPPSRRGPSHSPLHHNSLRIVHPERH